MISIRRARPADVPSLLVLQQAAYPVLAAVSSWKDHHLLEHQTRFPEGQFVAEEQGTVLGYSASFIARSRDVFAPHTFRDITQRGTFAGHAPDGDVLYGAEIMVHPDARRRGIGRRFYTERFSLAKRLHLRFFVAGGRLPGYHDVADKMSVEDFVKEVTSGRLVDRVLTAQLRIGLRVAGILPEYLADPKSRNYAALLVWENPEFKHERKETRLRAGARPRVSAGPDPVRTDRPRSRALGLARSTPV